jgi:hypothetical protein
MSVSGKEGKVRAVLLRDIDGGQVYTIDGVEEILINEYSELQRLPARIDFGPIQIQRDVEEAPETPPAWDIEL